MQFEPKIQEKIWDKNLEPFIFEKWQKDGIFKFNKRSRKKVFSIDTPPPYVNTPIHIGHAYTYVIMDMIARFKRMTGFNVLFPMGLDKNGLPIEVQAEKEFGISIVSTPREEFIQKCKELIKRSGDISLDSFKKLGLSCNSWETSYEIGGKYDTDDPEYRRLTQETFIKLWKEGLIYEDVKPANYCPVCRTTISDAEVEYEEKRALLNYIKFKVKETDEEIIIATTRPELLATCKLIIFNPEDERYKKLEGLHALVPIFGIEVPIISHPYAKPEFGSGLVMICSYGDYSDLRILRELNIEPTYAIDEEGKMNENAGKYKGLKVEEARKKIIEDLKSLNLIVKQEEIEQRQPVCWRSKNPIEFVPMKEFYLKQLPFKEDLLKISEELKFYAPESKQILIDWINSINLDWVISRRRYYGTEIPIWYCKKCGYIYVPEAGKYYVPWKEAPPIEACPKCGSKEFEGEKRVFDTWFDSSNSEIYILGYLWDKRFFEKNFPCSLRPQGKEIVRTWLYFTLLKAYLLFKKRAFEEVWLNHHVVDEKGEKMSKSAGNVIDPQEVLKRYGAEAFRIWTCLEGDITKGDIRCSFERIEGNSKFLTKFWNIARFVSMFPFPRKAKLMPIDEWILTELSKLIEKVRKSYENYSFYEGATSIRDFTWNLFASHYIEIVKKRAYGEGFTKEEQKAAWFTLHTCLKNLLLLLAPITPFITEHIWLKLYGNKSIHLQAFPKPVLTSDLDKLTQKIVEFNSKVWNLKKEKGFSLKDGIEIEIPEELKIFEKDLKAMHNIKN
ncbi:MAG: valine--tRNA ligase [Candidatus Aenigmatarchaeota archaeon]